MIFAFEITDSQLEAGYFSLKESVGRREHVLRQSRGRLGVSFSQVQGQTLQGGSAVSDTTEMRGPWRDGQLIGAADAAGSRLGTSLFVYMCITRVPGAC